MTPIGQSANIPSSDKIIWVAEHPLVSIVCVRVKPMSARGWLKRCESDHNKTTTITTQVLHALQKQ